MVKLQFFKKRYLITIQWRGSRFFLYVTRETILNFCRFCGYIDLFSSYYGNIEITTSEKFRVLASYMENQLKEKRLSDYINQSKNERRASVKKIALFISLRFGISMRLKRLFASVGLIVQPKYSGCRFLATLYKAQI